MSVALLRDKWTLALTFPAPLYPDRSPDAKPDAFEIAIAKVSRYFARIGFVQVCGDKPHDLNKYWALEKSKLGDVISVTKAESSSIVVQADIPPGSNIITFRYHTFSLRHSMTLHC